MITGCQSQLNKPQFILSSQQIDALSEQDILKFNEQVCRDEDKQSIVLANDHAINQRLHRLIQYLPNTINHLQLNYKVYLNTKPNAWSSANGCIRLNSGLIKLLTDDELLAVIAHEQGHIALKHAINAFQHAPYIEIYDKANKTVVMIKKETAQQNEIDADNYAIEILRKQKLNPAALISMLMKMPVHNDVDLTSHPAISKRINHISQKLNNIK